MACAIIEKTLGFEPPSETTAPSFYPFILTSLWMRLALFFITCSLVFSALIFILYLIQVLSRLSTRDSSYCSFSAGACMSSTNHSLVIFLAPMLAFPSCSTRAPGIVRSRMLPKRVGDRRHLWFTPTVVLNNSSVLPFIWLTLTRSLFVELLNGTI